MVRSNFDRYDLSEQPNNLVSLVAAADHMANHLQRGEPIEAYYPEENPGLMDLSARWNAARQERLLADIPDMMETARRKWEGRDVRSMTRPRFM